MKQRSSMKRILNESKGGTPESFGLLAKIKDCSETNGRLFNEQQFWQARSTALRSLRQINHQKSVIG
jgi:hypothetical protein